MRRIRAIGAPLGIVVGVLTGDDVEEQGIRGAGTAELALQLDSERTPEFDMRIRFFTVAPGVAVIYGNQRDRV